jgi:hypothetical protein
MRKRKLIDNPFASLPGADDPLPEAGKQLRDHLVKQYSAGHEP